MCVLAYVNAQALMHIYIYIYANEQSSMKLAQHVLCLPVTVPFSPLFLSVPHLKPIVVLHEIHPHSLRFSPSPEKTSRGMMNLIKENIKNTRKHLNVLERMVDPDIMAMIRQVAWVARLLDALAIYDDLLPLWMDLFQLNLQLAVGRAVLDQQQAGGSEIDNEALLERMKQAISAEMGRQSRLKHRWNVFKQIDSAIMAQGPRMATHQISEPFPWHSYMSGLREVADMAVRRAYGLAADRTPGEDPSYAGAGAGAGAEGAMETSLNSDLWSAVGGAGFGAPLSGQEIGIFISETGDLTFLDSDSEVMACVSSLCFTHEGQAFLDLYPYCYTC